MQIARSEIKAALDKTLLLEAADILRLVKQVGDKQRPLDKSLFEWVDSWLDTFERKKRRRK